MRRRYTDEALSRILSEHSAGRLKRGGRDWTAIETCPCETCQAIHQLSPCCVNQAAYNEPSPHVARALNTPVADWFDSNYDDGASPEALLAALEPRK